MVAIIAVGVLALAAVVGIGFSYYTKTDDSPIEEMAEEVIDFEAEKLLHLEKGTIKVDLTPQSVEDEIIKKKAALNGENNGT